MSPEPTIALLSSAHVRAFPKGSDEALPCTLELKALHPADTGKWSLLLQTEAHEQVYFGPVYRLVLNDERHRRFYAHVIPELRAVPQTQEGAGAIDHLPRGETMNLLSVYLTPPYDHPLYESQGEPLPVIVPILVSSEGTKALAHLLSSPNP